ncbi:MAG: UDP-N-acetylglucosamine 2-epimerase (hydrolyzing), partial [Candidatus Omnitrophica bacterium]|nr:UDP-N-acetylglucosamine 2-epimerase (hydrolyzing) [Candidatus Omnitrophota bacterium]
MRKICVVTVGRSDIGIYRPILEEMRRDPEWELQLIVSGAHLLKDFGLTVQEIEAEGIPIAQRLEILERSDDPEAVARSMGRGISAFSAAYSRLKPDLLLLAGDRFEMFAAAAAAVPVNLPIAHLHGGEISEGAMDEGFRHAMTKLAHLHFVSTEEHARRVIQMGEEPWRVCVSGAPALEAARSFTPWSPAMLQDRFRLRVEGPFLLVTFHPETKGPGQIPLQTEALLAALKASGRRVIFTMPNEDPSGRLIREKILSFVRDDSLAQAVEGLGTQAYFTLMSLAGAMVGNSSSGIIEAPSFKLPVVNIGNRQRGRLRARNVIDVEASSEAILSGIRQALSGAFRASLKDLVNPYSREGAPRIILERLKGIPLDQRLISKSFHDAPQPLEDPLPSPRGPSGRSNPKILFFGKA